MTAVEDRQRYLQALDDSDVASRTFGPLYEAAPFRTLDSARDIATVLANAFPQPKRVVIGLTELLVNAVEHGNLGITYEEKSRLREAEKWESEVDARLADPANAGKHARAMCVVMTRSGYASPMRVMASNGSSTSTWTCQGRSTRPRYRDVAHDQLR